MFYAPKFDKKHLEKAERHISQNAVNIKIKMKVSKVGNLSEGDQKDNFSIATTPRDRRGLYSFLWIAQLYIWSLPHNVEC